jgi:hypothetical protein
VKLRRFLVGPSKFQICVLAVSVAKRDWVYDWTPGLCHRMCNVTLPGTPVTANKIVDKMFSSYIIGRKVHGLTVSVTCWL